MTSAAYVGGIALLTLLIASLGAAAYLVRRRLLPDWSHCPARLAETVIALSTLILLAELLGTIGQFRRWPLVVCSVAIALVALLAFRRPMSAHIPVRIRIDADEFAAPRPGRWPSAIAAVAVAYLLALSMKTALDALHGGMRSFDTLWYHMPFAARFVQDGYITRLHYVGNTPTSFYPANGELVHAVGILLFQSDVVSPVVNIGWLGLALLSAWCIGRPFGAGPATTTAVALVAFLPVMGGAEAGTASTDIVGLALLLAAVALWITATGAVSALLVTGLAAGLAAGTRLNLWASLVALVVVVLVTAPAGRRLARGCPLLAGIIAGSAFWYVRNMVAVGNPLPWFGLKLAGLTLPSTTAPVDCGKTSVAHYATKPGFVRAHLLPQLDSALGGRWWLVLVLAVAGMIAGLVSRDTPVARGLAFVALVSGIAYLLTPATAGGDDARCFAFNTRFAVPALALGALALVLVLVQWRSGPLAAVLVFAVAIIFTVHVPLSPVPAVAAAVLVAGVSALAFVLRRDLPRAAFVATVAVAALLAVAGWHEQRIYVRDRYAHLRFTQPIERIARFMLSVRNARIAVSGFAESYPFYGRDLSNRVDYPARRTSARFKTYSTCRSWLLALSRGRYDYVVTAVQSAHASPAERWTRADPGAMSVLASAPGTERLGEPWRWRLFRLQPRDRVDAEAACRRTRA